VREGPERIVVVGVAGDVETLDKPARRAIEGADLVIGAPRHLDALCPPAARRTAIDGDVGRVLEAVAGERGSACVLASGDPGFFGIVRPLAARFGRERLQVEPAPSSVALAFARLGLAWDDAAVVSAHGRPLAEAAAAAARCPKAAVLVSPDHPPERLGQSLLGHGARHDHVAVCARLGLHGEQVAVTDLEGLASGSWDPLSVVVLWSGTGVAPARSLAWGLPDEAFGHRAGMVTTAEVRAVVLGKLDLPPGGVLWDVGAGSGSVGVEAARLAPGLEVIAVEREPADAARVRANADAHGVAVHVVEGAAPAALAGLPDPDRAFVGGGGLEVLDAVRARLRAGGRLVATFAALDRAAAAADRLGALVQVSLQRGTRLPDGGFRLAAANPVFVAWGPA
jgi:precorrin-6B C5,15-methyltransferase / cobalt-precorrin-6B C5,C15-methyltransferase